MSDFTVFTVFGRGLSVEHQGGEQLDAVIDELAAADIVTRGVYDVSGLRADADIMVWLHGKDAQALQSAVRRIRRTAELDWHRSGVERHGRAPRRRVQQGPRARLRTR